MKKIFVSSVLLICFILPSGVLAAFYDVNSKTNYSTSIEWMQENDVIEGYADGTFRPDNCVNRAEMLKLLFKVTNTKVDMERGDASAGSGYYDSMVKDIDTNAWYWKYVRYALLNGIVQGYEQSDGLLLFKPEQCVTRVEAIKMAMIVFNVETFIFEGDHPYLDVKWEEWYYEYLMPAIKHNLLGSEHVTSNNSGEMASLMFYPNESMPRKEVAEMLYRFKALKDNAWAESYSPELVPKNLELTF